MSDNKTQTGKADDSRINVNEDYELQYWSEKFGISRDELKAAVREVGPLAVNVEKYIQNNPK